MLCPSCSAENATDAEACFTCGKALHALTQGAVLAGRYEILSQLGQGGMGRVYKAFDRVLEEPVAVKVLRPEFAREPEMARRFLSEIKLARKVSHPNVCRIHEYNEDGGLRYISMELIEGVSLKEHLRKEPLTMADAFELALGAAWGLRAVHERGIIHRDFKTSNIMVDQHGRLRLVDFGIARVAGADTGTFTAAGQVFGTPEYMSPEQALGARLDFRSDLYALGCVVYEIFSGQAVFPAETPLVTLFKHINESPAQDAAWAARLPPALVPPLTKALAKEPADRYETVAQFAAALKEARAQCVPDAPPAAGAARPEPLSPPVTSTLHRSPAPSPPPSSTAPYAAPASARHRGLARMAAAAALLVAAVAAGLITREASQVHPPAEAGTLAPSPDAVLESPRPRPAAASPSAPPTPHGDGSPPAPAASAPALGVDARVPDLGRVTVGTLQLTVVPPAEVTVDGRLLGTVSAQALTLPPGTHVVRILHPDYMPLQRVVTITPGTTFDLPLDLAEKAIRRRR